MLLYPLARDFVASARADHLDASQPIYVTQEIQAILTTYVWMQKKNCIEQL